MAIDRRSRSGAAFDPADLTRQISQELALDEKLFLGTDGASPSADAAGTTIASRLTSARNQFLGRLQSDPYFFDTNSVREAVQLKNDLLMRAPYYVRWSVAAGRGGSAQEPLDRELAKMLPALAKLADRVEKYEPPPAAVTGTYTLPVEISENVDALNESHRAIEQAIEGRVKALEQHPNAAAIATLLDTPLPSAAARKRLLAARDRATEALPGDAPKKPFVAPAPVAWTKTVRQQVELEKQLVLLAEPGFRFASLDAAGSPDKSAADEQSWKTFGQFGQELGGFYRSLPNRIRKELSAGDSSAANRCDRYLRMVDARDAAAVPDEVLAVLLPHPQPRHEPQLAVQAESSAADADGQYSIKLAIEKKDLASGTGLITFDFPRGALALTTSDGKQSLSPDEPLRASCITAGRNSPSRPVRWCRPARRRRSPSPCAAVKYRGSARSASPCRSRTSYTCGPCDWPEG